MNRSCRYCGRYHKVGFVCPAKPVRQEYVYRKRKGNRREDAFRGSAVWQRKREEIRRRDRYLCRECLEAGRFTYDRLEVHHIAPLVENWDLRLEDGNLITLCLKHHEDAERGRLEAERLKNLAECPCVVDVPMRE